MGLGRPFSDEFGIVTSFKKVYVTIQGDTRLHGEICDTQWKGRWFIRGRGKPLTYEKNYVLKYRGWGINMEALREIKKYKDIQGIIIMTDKQIEVFPLSVLDGAVTGELRAGMGYQSFIPSSFARIFKLDGGDYREVSEGIDVVGEHIAGSKADSPYGVGNLYKKIEEDKKPKQEGLL